MLIDEGKNYDVILSPDAEKNLKVLKKENQEQLLKRIEELFVEISINPRTGRGKPERLKGYKDKEVWSRRLNGKDRIVYQIKDDVLEVLMLSLLGHYE